jgi:GNAT superfamily N-acetyltransferase
MQSVLVHVLEDRRCLPKETGPDEQVPQLDRAWRLKRVDDLPVWSISCFYVRKGYRRQGITSLLIAAALKRAKLARAPALEAYPLDKNLTLSTTFTGISSTFERAGFRMVARRVSSQPIMRHDLKAIGSETAGLKRRTWARGSRQSDQPR